MKHYLLLVDTFIAFLSFASIRYLLPNYIIGSGLSVGECFIYSLCYSLCYYVRKYLSEYFKENHNTK